MASHFNLFEPEGNCCEASIPQNPPQKFKIYLAKTDQLNLRKETKRKRQSKMKKKFNVKKATGKTGKALDPNIGRYVKDKPKSNTSEVKPKVKPTSSSYVDMSEENKATDFERMKVKELKEYVQIRGVPVSAYKKPELINLAQSLCEMKADVDSDFRDDFIDHVLKNRMTLPGGMIISDPFKMEHLSDQMTFQTCQTLG